MKPLLDVFGILLSLALFLLVVTLNGAERVAVEIDPLFVVRGGNVWVTCRVVRHADNRNITVGMPYHRLTDYQINGAKAPSMYRFLVQEVPCLAQAEASCVLKTNMDKTLMARRPIIVVGCDNEGTSGR